MIPVVKLVTRTPRIRRRGVRYVIIASNRMAQSHYASAYAEAVLAGDLVEDYLNAKKSRSLVLTEIRTPLQLRVVGLKPSPLYAPSLISPLICQIIDAQGSPHLAKH